jgi:hypothetical protein
MKYHDSLPVCVSSLAARKLLYENCEWNLNFKWTSAIESASILIVATCKIKANISLFVLSVNRWNYYSCEINSIHRLNDLFLLLIESF